MSKTKPSTKKVKRVADEKGTQIVGTPGGSQLPVWDGVSDPRLSKPTEFVELECKTPHGGEVLRWLEAASGTVFLVARRSNTDPEDWASLAAILDVAREAVREGRLDALQGLAIEARKVHQSLDADTFANDVRFRWLALKAAHEWLAGDRRNVGDLVNSIASELMDLAPDQKVLNGVLNLTSKEARKAISACKARLRNEKLKNHAYFYVNAVARSLGLDPKNWDLQTLAVTYRIL